MFCGVACIAKKKHDNMCGYYSLLYRNISTSSFVAATLVSPSQFYQVSVLGPSATNVLSNAAHPSAHDLICVEA